MGDWEGEQLYFAHQGLQQQDPLNGEDQDAALHAAMATGGDSEEDTPIDLNAVRRHFREFLRTHS